MCIRDRCHPLLKEERIRFEIILKTSEVNIRTAYRTETVSYTHLKKTPQKTRYKSEERIVKSEEFSCFLWIEVGKKRGK